MSDNLKRGDVAGYVFAQPGNSTTYLLLTQVREHDADVFDLFFNRPMKSVELSKLWPATEQEMQSGVTIGYGDRRGHWRVQDLASAARHRLGMDAA